jgi:hypothetical protein
MEKYMQQRIQKNIFRYRYTLPLLTCVALGALLLSACSSMIGGNGSSTSKTAVTPTPTLVPTPTISQAMHNQGNTELQTFQQWITLMQQNGGSVTTYQQQYNSDQQALSEATTSSAYQSALQTLENHVQAIQIPTMKQETQLLQSKLSKAVSAWGAQHQYYDSYNNTTYNQGYEYDSSSGVGGSLWLGEELSSDQTIADYQQTIEDLNMWLTSFQAMQANANDKTPYNQPHQTDLALMKHYNLMSGRVVVVSLNEQALRAYNNGQLVNAFQVTTGQPDLPTPPGHWWIEGKEHPTVFKSVEPKGSPDWYPPTPINYAMQYHSNGYFFHDAWWRTEFGPGTNFPHQDPDGDPFAGQGSHGCVNMSTSNSAWLYNFVSVYTDVIIY